MVVDRLLTDFGVVVKLLPDHEGGTPLVENAIRVSHHAFNDATDVQKFVDGLTYLLEEGQAAAQQASRLEVTKEQVAS